MILKNVNVKTQWKLENESGFEWEIEITKNNSMEILQLNIH